MKLKLREWQVVKTAVAERKKALEGGMKNKLGDVESDFLVMQRTQELTSEIGICHDILEKFNKVTV